MVVELLVAAELEEHILTPLHQVDLEAAVLLAQDLE
tara:strand:+ start:265 stop:372 length:108 start_codon:yes stop_codon:yes gene_type:complete